MKYLSPHGINLILHRPCSANSRVARGVTDVNPRGQRDLLARPIHDMQHIISRSLDREIRVPLHLDEAETCIARPRAARLHHTRACEPAMNIGRPADGPAKLE